MKKLTLLCCIWGSALSLNAQQVPTANNPGGTNTGRDNNQFWSRGGNTNTNGTNNIFGTLWNSPIYFYTNGFNGGSSYLTQSLRMKLNADLSSFTQYPINSYGWTQGVNTTGYLGLGYNSPVGSDFQWTHRGPFSQLHLNGKVGTFLQEAGYRPWMQTGITLTDNQDYSYLGIRQVGTAYDFTETVISWADNTPGEYGPDNVVFRFLGEGNGTTTISTSDLQTHNDLDGLHVATYSSSGMFGLGNTFGINPTGTPANLYVQPQSLGHYSLSNFRSVWQQFTNRDVNNGTGTGETATDGMRMGIYGNSNTNVNGTAMVYNQEARALLFSTNAPTNSTAPLTGGTLERVRVMSAGTPTHTTGSTYAAYNPAGVGTNITRFSISHDPSAPVTRPISLVHLGYNFPVAATYGYRNWMNIGTLTTNGNDQMYFGMKPETGTDRMDAIVNWGDNQDSLNADHLRFIFTSTSGDAVSQGANGLEVARMDPRKASTMPTNNYGMVGIGNFSPTGPNTGVNQVNAKLDIDGDLRIRTVKRNDSLTRILVIDSTDLNRVYYTEVNLPSGDGFVGCSDTVTSAALTEDSKIDLNNHNLYFENNDVLGQNHVGIGYDCSDPLLGKLSVVQTHPNPVNTFTVSVYGHNNDVSNAGALTFHSAFLGISDGVQTLPDKINNGGRFTATNGGQNQAVLGFAIGDPSNPVTQGNTGGAFRATNGQNAYGVDGTGIGANMWNIGGRFVGSGGDYAYGVMAGASSGAIETYAGYFQGDVIANAYQTFSDSLLKENVEPIENANNLLEQLNPVTFDYKTAEFPQMNLNDENQLGLIAQEVQTVLPNIVSQATSPAVYDSLGNEIHPTITFKVVDYNKLIPLLIAGHKEQTATIDSLQIANDDLQEQVTDLNDRLTQLENCLSGILPFLCQMNQSAIQSTPEELQEKIAHEINVTLSNRNNIILNQNVPNPFAESTVITYSIPSTVGKAQIHFYDGQGKLINSVDIVERGNGSLNVFANDLSTGVYTYSLVADGVIVATKRMVKQ